MVNKHPCCEGYTTCKKLRNETSVLTPEPLPFLTACHCLGICKDIRAKL